MLGDKKVSYSAMQSTGTLTLGNYLGALDNWLKMQEEYECFYAIADLHSLTIRQNPAELRKRARDLYALYVAAGLDPEKNCIYFQSHVSAHAELAWILNCFTYMGELNRMTQFKDKAAKHADNIASILLMDDPDTIIRKFKRAVTDSDMEIRYSDDKPGIQNLINIYSCITGKTIEEVEKEFDGKGYGEFKLAVGECVANRLKPLQDRFYELQKDKTYLNSVIKENDEKAAYFANKTLRKVQKKVGLTERIR